MKRLLFAVLWAGMAWQVQAQLQHENRLEIDNSSTKFFIENNLLPLDTDGFLLVSQYSKKNGSSNFTFVFSKYDTLLHKHWEKSQEISLAFELLKSAKTSENAYWLFGKEHSNQRMLCRVNFEFSDIETINLDTPAIDSVDFFKVMGSRLLLAGRFRDKPVILSYNVLDNTQHIFQELFEPHLHIEAVIPDIFRQEIMVLIKSNKFRKNCSLALKRYNLEGVLLETNEITTLNNEHLLATEVIQNKDGSWLLFGSVADACQKIPKGFYVATIVANKKPAVSVLNFSDFDNYFAYLPPKSQQKNEERQLYRKNTDKPRAIYQHVFIKSPVPTSKGYLLTADAFDINNNPMPPVSYRSELILQSNSTFKPYHFTHAIVCEIDSNKHLCWNKTIKIDDTDMELLNAKTVVFSGVNTTFVAYLKESDLFQQELNTPQLHEIALKKRIETGYATDKLQRTTANLEKWYGNTYLVWGEQKIDNFGDSTPSASREVFFVNVLRFKGK